MLHFFRLVRPLNLLIVIATMLGVKYYLQSNAGAVINHPNNFVMLIISTVLIAAGGNIINDYFDVRTDRANRPEKVIIGKYIKRRWAIVLHWGFNAVAFAIGLYLGWIYKSFLFIGIHISAMTILWWYSVTLKKKALIGNATIALLTVLVIYLSVGFIQLDEMGGDFNAIDPLLNLRINHVLLLFMVMAFIHNFLREIIKDAEDVKGDKLIGANTLPMLIGVKRTTILVAIFTLLFPVLYLLHFLIEEKMSQIVFVWPLSLAAFNNVLAFFSAIIMNEKTGVVYLKNSLKISMLLALIYLFN